MSSAVKAADTNFAAVSVTAWNYCLGSHGSELGQLESVWLLPFDLQHPWNLHEEALQSACLKAVHPALMVTADY